MPIYDHAGNAPPTVLTADFDSLDLTAQCADLSGWPAGGASGKFWVTFARDTPNEMRCLAQAKSGNNLTFASTGDKGLEGTANILIPSGSTVEHTFSKTEADDANNHIFDTTRDDHTQYHNAARHAGTSHTQAMMGVDSVGSAQIIAGAVGNAELGADAVTADKIAANAVGSSEIATGAVGADEIAAGAVGSSELGADSVIAGKIADDAINDPNEFGTDIRPLRRAIAAPAVDLQAGDVWVDSDATPQRAYYYSGAAWVPFPLQLIELQTLGIDTNTITFTGIPQDFEHLRLIVVGASDRGTDIVRSVSMRFNADSGANYHSQINDDGTFAQTLGDTDIKIGELDGDNDGFTTAIDLMIYGYKNTGKDRKVIGACHSTQSANIHDIRFIGSWNNTIDAITSISIFQLTTGWEAGSKFYLYGI